MYDLFLNYNASNILLIVRHRIQNPFENVPAYVRILTAIACFIIGFLSFLLMLALASKLPFRMDTAAEKIDSFAYGLFFTVIVLSTFFLWCSYRLSGLSKSTHLFPPIVLGIAFYFFTILFVLLPFATTNSRMIITLTIATFGSFLAVIKIPNSKKNKKIK